jgi:hypothetical protein
LSEVQDLIAKAAAKLEPYVKALTPLERRMLPKMGRKSLSFVEKAMEYARQNPKLCPSFMDMEAFESHLNTAQDLWKFANSIYQLADNMSDTELSAGSEAFKAALVFYQNIKVAVKQDVPGAKRIHEELKSRFPRRSYNRKTPETQETANT